MAAMKRVKKQTGFRLSEEAILLLDAAAALRGLTRTSMLEELIRTLRPWMPPRPNDHPNEGVPDGRHRRQ